MSSNFSAKEYKNTLRNNCYNELINEEKQCQFCIKNEQEKLLFIGKENCVKCDQVLLKLAETGIYFTYKEVQNLSEEKFKEYRQKAKECDNLTFPILIKDGKSLTLKEVIEIYK